MKSAKLKTITRLLLGCAALVPLAAPALAEDQIETVMVTAERHAENQQDVPISISTLQGDDLDVIFQSGQDIKAIAAHVPSLYAESSNGRAAPRFYIRGLGNADFDLAASQPVSIIMDDVVMENVVLKSSPLYDLANVEVDRGPQGTLFGRNTTAGVIKFTSARPTQEQDGYLSASTGEYGTTNVEAAFGDGLSDTLSFRVSGLWQHRADYIDNAYTGQNNALGGYDERAGRAQLLWQPNDDFSALLNVHGRSLDGTAAIFRANIFTRGSNKLNGNYIADKVFFDAGANNPQKYDGLGSGLTMTYRLPGMTLTSITGYETTHGYSRGDIDGGNLTGPGIIFFPSESQDGLDYLHQFTQELHLASDYGASNPLFWQVGGFYFSTDYQDTTFPYFIPPTHVRQSNVSYAVFGQARYAITDAFTATAGIRWTSDVKGMTADGPLDTIVVPVKARGSNVSWDVSLAYAINDDVNVYSRVATGFRAPSIQGRNIAFNTPPGNYSIARSETVTSYEMGIKTELLDHRLRVNFDGFTYYIHNPQFSAVGGATVGNSIVLLNARGGQAGGVEFDAQWLATDNLLLTLGGSYTHTAIHDSSLTTGVCAQCTVTDPLDAKGNAILNGNPFPQAPDWLLSASAKYTYPLAGGDSLFFYTNWWWQGYTNFFLYTSKEFHTNGNYEGDIKIGYTFPNGKYDIYAYAQNITDKANVQGGIDFDDLTGFVSDPRVVGIGFDYHL
ncbi:MAG: TonB-dependent receptor [Alphaproteobacteria bacterium]|nr:TonB-dependent receptor [Alphaproteobacteria bacterium]